MSGYSALSKSLIISIIIILAGITMIIFMQFDRGYVYPAKPSSLPTEQIHHIYQSQQNRPNTKNLAVQANVHSMPETYPFPNLQIPQAKRPVTRQSYSATNKIGNNGKSEQFGGPVFLRDNPWNPYYKPQY